MLVYIDSSALLKRVLDEDGSAELEAAIKAWSAPGLLLTSTLTTVEVSRALRRRLDDENPGYVRDACVDAMRGVHELSMTEAVLSLARRIGSPMLRSLDALHLATAVLSDADVVVSYDERMRAVAEGLGFITEQP